MNVSDSITRTTSLPNPRASVVVQVARPPNRPNRDASRLFISCTTQAPTRHTGRVLATHSHRPAAPNHAPPIDAHSTALRRVARGPRTGPDTH
eukprot:4365403-Prymnesium_polylepis.1